MKLTEKQRDTQSKIWEVCNLFDVDPSWACAVAMVESSLGLNQKSPTGCRGVFQMSSIAMKDLLYDMEKTDDDMIDIACGVLFLRLLYRRHGSIETATERYCDPKDRDFYVGRVMDYMDSLEW